MNAIEFCKILDEELGEYWSNDYDELPEKMEEYAKIYHEQQLKILNIPVVSCSACDIIEIETTIQLLPRKWWQFHKRGWQTHTDFFGHRYFVRYHWIK